MTQPTIKAINANPIKLNNGTVLHGGNVSSTGPIQKNLSLADTTYLPYYGSHPNLADGSPVESGTVGTQKAISAGVFAKMEENKYVGKILGTRVAQTSNTFLRSGASDISGRHPMNHYARGDRRYNITSWSYTTGAATKGGSAGVRVTYVDPETGNTQAVEPFPTKTVPGRIVFMVNGKSATRTTYSQKNG